MGVRKRGGNTHLQRGTVVRFPALLRRGFDRTVYEVTECGGYTCILRQQIRTKGRVKFGGGRARIHLGPGTAALIGTRQHALLIFYSRRD